MKNKISVIIPVYKVEKYLKRCVDSVMAQSYSHLEIILIDDGSPDECPKICDDYAKKDQRIKVIHQKNGGLSAARNAGIDLATGDYIGFVDSDDYIHKDMYKILLEQCLKEGAELSLCRFKKFSGEEISEEELVLELNPKVLTAQEAIKGLHIKHGIIYCLAWNKLYKKELFNELRFPVGKINEDEFLNYKLLDRAKRIVSVEGMLYFYYQGNGLSITNDTKYLSKTDAFEALEERERYFKNKGDLELEVLVHNAYLERVLLYYKKWRKAKERDRELGPVLIKRFREKYREKPSESMRKGYRLFNRFPRTYCLLKGNDLN